MSLRIGPAEPRHRGDWDRLYAGYAAFYGVPQTAGMRDTVWGWILDPAHEVEALIAEDEAGRAVGLAHLRRFARPLRAAHGGYLDDLFVEPEQRGRGVADALLAACAALGRERGWNVIRWITAEDNARARAVYGRCASLTAWRTYDIPL
jgi:GNAT superfamily N-acetyltransferase